jgi:hypothetical protein
MGRLSEWIMQVEARIKIQTRTNVVVDVVQVIHVSDIKFFEYECVRNVYDRTIDTYTHAPSNNIWRTFAELNASKGLIKVGVALQSQRLVLRMASFHGTAQVNRLGIEFLVNINRPKSIPLISYLVILWKTRQIHISSPSTASLSVAAQW